jgi:hypothetical protein
MSAVLKRLLASAGLALFGGGCAMFGGLDVQTVAASAQKPSNVALYVSVTEGDEPVTDLEPKHFRIYENGQELASHLTERTLLARAPVTDERVLLLVDVSGNPRSAQLTNYADAVEAFVRKVSAEVPVSVRVFDGSPSLKSVGDYARGSANPSAMAITKLASKDGSRDLNGAVLSGLAELDKTFAGGRKPVRLGTLVVFARGPDLAGRVEEAKVSEALNATHHDVIGVGIGQDTPFLWFARGGKIHAQSADTLPIAFEEAGARVAATHAKYYLLAYCSPARAGQRRVRIEVMHEDKEGNEHSGSTEYEFDATGFGPGCRAETTPRFEQPKEPGENGSSAEDSSAHVNQGPSSDPDAVVPPPSSGDYAK